MKVYLGKYKSWVGPYQIANLLQYIGFSDDQCYAVGKWLCDTPLEPICQWLHRRSNRTVKVRIDPYDVWNMDHTVSLIVLPMLIQLKKSKHGAPRIDDEDVPNHLKSTAAPPVENEWDTDDNYFARFDHVLDEMIWAFEQAASDNWQSQFHHGVSDIAFVDGKLVRGPLDTTSFDQEGYQAHFTRMQNGTRLFGKYFFGLWD